MSTLEWVAVTAALVFLLAWYLSYSASRLDRLHAKVEGALSALDAALVRRAEAALELANSGSLDPATGFLVAAAVRVPGTDAPVIVSIDSRSAGVRCGTVPGAAAD